MSDSNRTAVAITEETGAIGTTPATPPFENLRVTGESLQAAKKTVVSNELRSDAQVTDLITVGFEPAGDIPQEMSYGAIDTLMRGVLRSEWTYTPIRYNNGTADSIITAVDNTGIYTFLANAGTPTNSGVYAIGHLVRFAGFTNALNNKLARVTATTATTTTTAVATTTEAVPPGTARMKVIGFEGAVGDITSTATGLGSTALNFTTLGLAIGMWVWVGGSAAGNAFANAGVTGWCRISAIAATALSFDIMPATWAVDAGAGKSIRTYWGDYMRNGTTRRAYTLELQYQDLVVPEFDYFRGAVPVNWDLEVPNESIMTVKTSFMGMTAPTTVTARFAGATDVAAPTNDVMNTSSNIGSLLVNGVLLGSNVCMGASVSVNNTGRRNKGLGSLTSTDIRQGRFIATGKLSMYYADNTVLNYIRNSSAVSFFLPLLDPTGQKAYVIDFPRIKLNEGSPNDAGVDQDRTLDTDFQAVRHLTLGYTMHFQRIEEFLT